MNHAQRGYVALMAVLIVGAGSLAIVLALLTAGVDGQKSSLAQQQSIQARKLADACGEEALQKIQEDTAYTGSGNLTLGQGTCTYTVSAGTPRPIDAAGVVNNVTRKIKVYVTITGLNISITSWQEQG